MPESKQLRKANMRNKRIHEKCRKEAGATILILQNTNAAQNTLNQKRAFYNAKGHNSQ